MFARHSLWVFFFLTYLINKSGINFGGGWDNYLNWFFFQGAHQLFLCHLLANLLFPGPWCLLWRTLILTSGRSVLRPSIRCCQSLCLVSDVPRHHCPVDERAERLPRSLKEGDGAGARAQVVWSEHAQAKGEAPGIVLAWTVSSSVCLDAGDVDSREYGKEWEDGKGHGRGLTRTQASSTRRNVKV